MEKIIAVQNPWKRGKSALSQEIIDRKIIHQINPWLDEEDIIVIKGARQAGKTTIIYCMIDQLIAKGIRPENIFYFLIDNFTLQQRFAENPYVLKTTLEQFIGESLENYDQRIYIFLDEVQKIPKFSEVVKEYFDLFKNLKFIISFEMT